MQKLVLHFTILLLVFGAAAYKAEHTAALACSLLGECSTIFFLLGKMQVSHIPAEISSRQTYCGEHITKGSFLRSPNIQF